MTKQMNMPTRLEMVQYAIRHAADAVATAAHACPQMRPSHAARIAHLMTKATRALMETRRTRHPAALFERGKSRLAVDSGRLRLAVDGHQQCRLLRKEPPHCWPIGRRPENRHA
jgi:hypothetical protein